MAHVAFLIGIDDWEPALDLAAYVLPIVLALVGVWVSVETPALETRKQRNVWRAGLVIFGLVVSVVAYEQQKVARLNADKSTKEQIELLKKEQATRYIPAGILVYENKRFTFYNKARSTLYIWGDKLDDLPKDMPREPRIIPIDANYYFLADKFENYILQTMGPNAEKTLPFDIYFKNELGVKYISHFDLLIKVKDGKIEVHTQMLSFDPKEW